MFGHVNAMYMPSAWYHRRTTPSCVELPAFARLIQSTMLVRRSCCLLMDKCIHDDGLVSSLACNPSDVYIHVPPPK